MRLLFNTKHRDAPSTIFNSELLKFLNDIDGVKIDFFNQRYEDYDVVLFMGYDPEIENARAANPGIKIGVIDPRPSSKNQPVGADFILANGIEMKDWYIKYSPNICIYYIYPVLPIIKAKASEQSKKIVIGYHGNKVHLDAMHPRVTKALDMLAETYDVEFWAIYDIERLGQWKNEFTASSKVEIQHTQWDEKNYIEYLSKANIGIVPDLIPFTATWRFSFKKNKFNEHETDYLLRFKATSNPGRIAVFAQLGIPVVADMFPSAVQLIEDGVNGFISYSTEAWYFALKKLADDAVLRHRLGENLQSKFQKTMSPMVLNNKLIEFLRSL